MMNDYVMGKEQKAYFEERFKDLKQADVNGNVSFFQFAADCTKAIQLIKLASEETNVLKMKRYEDVAYKYAKAMFSVPMSNGKDYIPKNLTGLQMLGILWNFKEVVSSLEYAT